MSSATTGQQKWNQRVAKLAATVLVIACAWLLAKLTWTLLEPTDTSLPPAINTAAATPSDTVNVNLNVLVNHHLFGQVVAAAPPPVAPTPTPVQQDRIEETNLKNLKLIGVLASNSAEFARAIIKEGSKPTKVYAINDEIVRGATLNQVNMDHIVIERNGTLEILRMKKATAGLNTGNNSRSNNRQTVNNLTGINRNNSNQPVAERITAAREELLADPSKVTDYLRYRPQMKDGQVIGYRIYPGKDRALFRDVGLRSGDLVTAVNGIPLSDPAQALALIPQLQTATSASITLQRRGQEQTINVSTLP